MQNEKIKFEIIKEVLSITIFIFIYFFVLNINSSPVDISRINLIKNCYENSIEIRKNNDIPYLDEQIIKNLFKNYNKRRNKEDYPGLPQNIEKLINIKFKIGYFTDTLNYEALVSFYNEDCCGACGNCSQLWLLYFSNNKWKIIKYIYSTSRGDFTINLFNLENNKISYIFFENSYPVNTTIIQYKNGLLFKLNNNITLYGINDDIDEVIYQYKGGVNYDSPEGKEYEKRWRTRIFPYKDFNVKIYQDSTGWKIEEEIIIGIEDNDVKKIKKREKNLYDIIKTDDNLILIKQ